MKTSKRDPFLDSLRGIFHVIMMVDHLPLILPDLFTAVVGLYEIVGYVTVAEGFVFLSGYVSGLVYTKIKRERGETAMWRKALARAAGIYFCYIFAVIMLIAVVRVVGYSGIAWGAWDPLFGESFGKTFVRVAALLHQPTFLEILPMYCGLLIITPLMIGLLERGHCAVIVILSFGIWVAAQYNARDAILNLMPWHKEVNRGYFNSLAWQLLFVSGLVGGHKTCISNRHWLSQGWGLPMLASVTVCVLFLFRHHWLAFSMNPRWIERATVAPIRLLNFYCIILLLSKFRPQIQKFIAWRGFAFLSRHSLQVFAFHLFPIYIVALVLVGGRPILPIWLQLLTVSFCIAGLFVIATITQYAKSVQQHFGGTGQASPAKLVPKPQ
jgi:hypothetical protein